MKQIDFQTIFADQEKESVFSQGFIMIKNTEDENGTENAQRLVDERNAVQVCSVIPENNIQQNGARETEIEKALLFLYVFPSVQRDAKIKEKVIIQDSFDVKEQIFGNPGADEPQRERYEHQRRAILP